MGEHVTVRERNSAKVARMEAAVAELKPVLAAYAREHGGRFVLFGSAARREMHPDSDVDILVDFPDGARMQAMSFAEDACWERGLTPDILGFGAAADETRKFRHFASHSYDEPFDPEEARPAVEAARLLAARLEAEMQDVVNRLGSG